MYEGEKSEVMEMEQYEKLGNGKGQRKREELRQNNAVKAKQIHSLRCQHLWSAVSHAAENQVESREREQIYLADSW